ncbi:DUF1764-domain-containing protein [Paxillus ammoniavirescens]|nr:DUF1764-domain-containing protein [Paxillus ammoniavirescens]
MPASEIDDIFASKGKANIVSKSPSVRPSLPEKKKKKKKKALSTPVEESKKRSAPETVVDPSVQSVFKKRLKSASSNPTQPSFKDQLKEDEERFKDSRGSGPRRKTQEGYNIYNEDELGMSASGGDTPLCPFDCQCCF